ncbi:MAG: glycine zipper 2TM domain-containing protein [Alphaproteobacteria bacterium]|nr:glycine zipper 2TM domain-containing protein [Alphaproteobacteria bacterium]
MFSKNLIAGAVVAGLMMPALSACTQTGNGGGIDSNAVGTVLGGVAGGFLGSQFGEGSGKVVASVAGAMLGAWAGSKIVQGMNAQDRGYYESASTRAATAPVGQQITWYNPQTGNQGTITPTREGRTGDGAACREYQQTVTIGGKTERAYGTACKQADGSWKIIN